MCPFRMSNVERVIDNGCEFVLDIKVVVRQGWNVMFNVKEANAGWDNAIDFRHATHDGLLFLTPLFFFLIGNDCAINQWPITVVYSS